MPSTKLKRAGRISAIAALVALALAFGGLGFGLGGGDVARMRAFADAVRNWQTNPDFRNVQRDYVTLGTEAMRGRLCGLSGETVVMSFRSLPGLPKYLSVSTTSAAHYRAFARGDLSAYLHLASEQGVGDGLKMIVDLGSRVSLTDADIVGFLRGFKLPASIVSDAGAVASVRALLRDVDAARALEIRDDVVARLRLHVEDPELMTRDQQRRAFAALDERVRAIDPELWRTKQVSDFLAGIWAQGYGQIYLTGIEWMLHIRSLARVIFVVTIVLGAGLIVRRRKSVAAAGALLF